MTCPRIHNAGIFLPIAAMTLSLVHRRYYAYTRAYSSLCLATSIPIGRTGQPSLRRLPCGFTLHQRERDANVYKKNSLVLVLCPASVFQVIDSRLFLPYNSGGGSLKPSFTRLRQSHPVFETDHGLFQMGSRTS